jgi:hypothetical protein
VEVLAPREGMGAVPYVGQEWFSAPSNVNALLSFHQLWFANKNPQGNPRFNNPHNYFHLMGASRKNVDQGVLTGYSFDFSDVSFIFLESIRAGCPSCSGSELVLYGQETVDHELAHQFRVNGCDSGGHDQNNAWCGDAGGSCVKPALGSQYCLMHSYDSNSNAMRTSGVNRLDCDDLAGQGPSCGIPACAEGISVRTDTDPE